MPFIGSINAKLRQFFATHAKLLDGRDCYIGCSGNFSIEQILTRHAPNARLYSNDVSLYSCVLGNALVGRLMKLQVVNEELRWLQPYLDNALNLATSPFPVAALLLMMEMLKYEKKNSVYAVRMWEYYQAHWNELFAKTLSKVLKAMEHIKIAEYTAIDVYDYFDTSLTPRLPGEGQGVRVGFLPTYEGGYERLFKRLEESIAWDKPKYEMLTTERREETVRRMTRGDYVLYDDKERPELPCVARMDLFGKKSVFIYSNLPFPKGIIRRRLRETDPKLPILAPDENIPDGADIRLREVPQDIIDHYRAMWLAKSIEPGSGGPCYLAMVDGKVLGCLIFQAYSKKKGEVGSIYLLSDFVRPAPKERRLAKLLLMVSLCADTRRVLEEKLLSRLTCILTTAFTPAKQSMKYRGIYKLVKRSPEGAEKPFLNYQGEFSDMTFKEVVSIWKKKHCKP